MNLFPLQFYHQSRKTRRKHIRDAYVCDPVTLWIWPSAKIYFRFWDFIDDGLQRGIENLIEFRCLYALDFHHDLVVRNSEKVDFFTMGSYDMMG